MHTTSPPIWYISYGSVGWVKGNQSPKYDNRFYIMLTVQLVMILDK